MKHVASIRFIVQRWRELAMRDGYTDHTTVVYAEPVVDGWLPAFTVPNGTQIVARMSAPFPNERAARNSLRDLLQQALDAGRINLNEHPAAQEQVV